MKHATWQGWGSLAVLVAACGGGEAKDRGEIVGWSLPPKPLGVYASDNAEAGGTGGAGEVGGNSGTGGDPEPGGPPVGPEVAPDAGPGPDTVPDADPVPDAGPTPCAIVEQPTVALTKTVTCTDNTYDIFPTVVGTVTLSQNRSEGNYSDDDCRYSGAVVAYGPELNLDGRLFLAVAISPDGLTLTGEASSASEGTGYLSGPYAIPCTVNTAGCTIHSDVTCSTQIIVSPLSSPPAPPVGYAHVENCAILNTNESPSAERNSIRTALLLENDCNQPTISAPDAIVELDKSLYTADGCLYVNAAADARPFILDFRTDGSVMRSVQPPIVNLPTPERCSDEVSTTEAECSLAGGFWSPAFAGCSYFYTYGQ